MSFNIKKTHGIYENILIFLTKTEVKVPDLPEKNYKKYYKNFFMELGGNLEGIFPHLCKDINDMHKKYLQGIFLLNILSL